MQASGNLSKMRTELQSPVNYFLQLGDNELPLNEFVGKEIVLQFENQINCVNCGRKTNKSFGQGFCYPCFMNSPENAECIVRPELCRGHLGEGRDPKWELAHHVQPHVVYLASSSDIKVGVTRSTQVPFRWIDQGASSAIELARTNNRYEAGMIEVEMKKWMSDKTNWQRMLKGEKSERSLLEVKALLKEKFPEEFLPLFSPESEIVEIEYPVIRYPQKVASVNFDKMPEIKGVLYGIKGQYLIFEDNRVLNIRNQSGYLVSFNA